MRERFLLLSVICVYVSACSHTSSIAAFIKEPVSESAAPDDAKAIEVLVLEQLHVAQMPFVPVLWKGYSIRLTIPAGAAVAGNSIASTDPGADFQLFRLGRGSPRPPEPLSGRIEIMRMTDGIVDARVVVNDAASSWSLDRVIHFEIRVASGRT